MEDNEISKIMDEAPIMEINPKKKKMKNFKKKETKKITEDKVKDVIQEKKKEIKDKPKKEIEPKKCKPKKKFGKALLALLILGLMGISFIAGVLITSKERGYCYTEGEVRDYGNTVMVDFFERVKVEIVNQGYVEIANGDQVLVLSPYTG